MSASLTSNMRALGIDYGGRRIGLAVTDPDGKIALPAGTLERRGTKQDIVAIQGWINKKEIDCIVIGLPLHMNGSRGPETDTVLAFAAELQRETGCPVDTIDERWSTLEAKRTLQQEDISARERRSASIDAVAATLLLGTWLKRQETE